MADGAGYGFGDCQPVTVQSPAAGAGFTYSVPGSESQLVLAVTFQLATSADVADRRPVVNYRDVAGVSFAAIPAPFVQAASLTTLYTFALGVAPAGDDGAANVAGPLPYLPLDVGETVVVTVVNIDNTDQISAVRLFVEQRHVRE